MKRILFDTDVVLDVLLQRQPFFTASALAIDTVAQVQVLKILSLLISTF